MFLNCHTYHSYHYGLMSPAQLVQQAVDCGVTALALTDINNSACAVEFHRLCSNASIAASIGAEFWQNGRTLYIVLAKNAHGMHALHQLLNRNSVHQKALPMRPSISNCIVLYPKLPCRLRDLAPHEYQLVKATQVFAQKSAIPGSLQCQKQVAWHPITLAQPGEHHLHQILRAIGEKKLLGHPLRNQTAASSEHMVALDKLGRKFQHAPWLLRNAARILEETHFNLDQGLCVNRPNFGADRWEDLVRLRALAWKGRARRYAANHPTVALRLKAELDLIERLNLECYFLTTWDIVRYARRRKFFYVGRGSGANSVVAYCLFITDVDPIELNLYFERFINPYREQPPDFDIDFSHFDRDDVWQYVFDKYTPDHAAVLGTYQRYKGKSLVRSIGSVLGLSKSEQDMIVQEPWSDAKHHPMAKKIFAIGHQLRMYPSHLGMHVGGIIIGGKPLSYTTALKMMPKGVPVTMMDMHHASEWGYHKLDILSQRGLSHVQKAIQWTHGKIDVAGIRDMACIKADSKVQKLLQDSACIGCFYIESPAMRGLLAKLKCRTYKELIAACSIIRPGVAKSGMMQRYIDSHLGKPLARNLHPLFREHLADTYGIMVYQEDVMKMVHLFADFDMHEADMLRRLMTGKRKFQKELTALQAKFYAGAAAKGHREADIKEIWRQVASFSGYAFCKAHSASYAVESLQSLYLKAHFPLQFIMAVIDCAGGFYPTECYVHEARRLGAVVEPPCINRTGSGSTLISNRILLGFKHLKKIRYKTLQLLLAARSAGCFTDFPDFLSRVSLPFGQLDLLIRIGAFRTLAQDKTRLYGILLRHYTPHRQQSLFPAESGQQTVSLPVDSKVPADDATEEVALLGFALSRPFDRYMGKASRARIVAKQMVQHQHLIVEMLGYYLIEKPVTTAGGGHMCFATWIDECDEYFDTVHFPRILERHGCLRPGFYRLQGKVTVEHAYAMLTVTDAVLLQANKADL
ncbi:MAG: DNA polymerase III subunit alpha [Saprospiraceae bacterium]|nr:DNA polymerase III subunit alpha [Saprospiraceae bacterium]